MSKKIFSLNNDDAKENRKRRFFLIATFLLAILAILIVLLAIFIPRILPSQIRECRKKYFGLDSFVCVCSAEYCDEIEPIGDIGQDEFVYFLSSRDSHRLKRFSIKEDKKEGEDLGEENVVEIGVNASVKFQSVMGFGGAFTDSVGLILNSLNPRAREILLRGYFDRKRGIGYSIGRVPIASTDFSSRVYSYADIDGDFEMKNFGLAIEDLEYKIPNLISARRMVGGNSDDFRLYASPWSPPWWMKENGRMPGGGPMKGKVVGENGNDTQYFRAYAKYLRKFFEEYAKRDVQFWGMTIENESNEQRQNYFQALFISPEMQRQFAYHLLSPELKKSEAAKKVKIMALDDQRVRIAEGAKTIYSNLTESSAIDGLAVHWYSFDGYSPLEGAHQAMPSKFIIGSEASCGDQGNGEFRGPQLGNWTRGWMYGHDILNDMANWVVGWVDWNLCLDTKGGPNWFGNTIDAAIIVNLTAQEFYKQPIFYFMAHFSHFVPRNSLRISSKMFDSEGNELFPIDAFFLKEIGPLEQIAFETLEGNLVLILLNGNAQNEQMVKIRYGQRKWSVNLPADSIATAIFKK